MSKHAATIGFMKGNFGILLVIAVVCSRGIIAGGTLTVNTDAASTEAAVSRVADRLDSFEAFSADVRYEVSLAMSDDEVVYNLQVASQAAPADTLLGVDYLIDWQLPRSGDVSTGFAAYFDGHCYRFRDHRLQEYHFDWDSIPFRTSDGGVQATGQFVELIPLLMARQLRAMLADDSFMLTYSPHGVFNGREVDVVEATQTVGGYVGRTFRLCIDPSTGLPLQTYNEYNPGSISEQSVRVTFTYPADNSALRAVSAEESLVALYPAVFEKCRESNYRIENIRGFPVPAFSLPTLTGERYTRQRNASFRAPTVIAIIDASTGVAAPTVEALRKARRSMPREVDLIFAFTGSNIDSIEEVLGPVEPGEADLMSARAFARDCGTTVYPTIMIVDTRGIVADVKLGFNNSLASDVIQSLALID